MRAKFVNEAIKHLTPRSEEEIKTNVLKSDDVNALLQLAEEDKKNRNLYIKRIIEVNPDYYVRYCISKYPLNDELRQILKKHVNNIKDPFLLIKIGKALKEKSYVDLAIQKLQNPPKSSEKLSKISTDINNLCKQLL